MELQFEWDQVAAFVTQPDGSLFSWRERFTCFRYLIYGIVSATFLYTSLMVPTSSSLHATWWCIVG
jgi:hypothetical protein